jgi:hypothetical protein
MMCGVTEVPVMLSSRTLLVTAALGQLVASIARAQDVVQGEIVVPVQSVFTVGTTVSVPDRGYTSVGGFRRSSRTRTEVGGLNRGLARGAAAGDVVAHAWIHDFEELEPKPGGDAGAGARPASEFAAAMRRPARDFAGGSGQRAADPSPAPPLSQRGNRTARAAALAREARELQAADKPADAARLWVEIREQHAGTTEHGEALRALAAIKDRPGVAAVVHEPRAADFLKRAQEAEAAGKLKVARTHYRSAARLTPAPSARVAQERMQVLEVKLAGP